MNQPLPSVHDSSEDNTNLNEDASSKANPSESSTSLKSDDMEAMLNRIGSELIEHVQERPLTSLLVAAGFGFAFASLFKK